MTDLQMVLRRFLDGDIDANAVVDSDAWRDAAPDVIERTVAARTFAHTDVDRLVELWRVSPSRPTMSRSIVERLLADAAVAEPTRRAVNELWLEEPLDDLSVAGLLASWPRSDVVWVAAVTSWGEGTLDDDTVKVLMTEDVPPPMRAGTAPALGALSAYRCAMDASTRDALLPAIKTLLAIDISAMPSSVTPALAMAVDEFVSRSADLKIDWSKSPVAKDVAKWLGGLKKVEYFSSKERRALVSGWQRFVKSGSFETHAPRRPARTAGTGSAVSLASLSLDERSREVKDRWAAGWDPEVPVLSTSGRDLLLHRITDLEARLVDIRKHKKISHDLSGDGGHDNPGLNQLRLEEEALMRDIAVRQRELVDALEIAIDPRPTEHVSIGSVVMYQVSGSTCEKGCCEIVCLGEEDAAAAKVSYRTPLAMGLRGLGVSDRRTLEGPAGLTTYEVLAITVPS